MIIVTFRGDIVKMPVIGEIISISRVMVSMLLEADYIFDYSLYIDMSHYVDVEIMELDSVLGRMSVSTYKDGVLVFKQFSKYGGIL